MAGGRVISALRSDWLMAPQSARTLYVSETYFCPNVNSIIREKKGGERERKVGRRKLTLIIYSLSDFEPWEEGCNLIYLSIKLDMKRYYYLCLCMSLSEINL